MQAVFFKDESGILWIPVVNAPRKQVLISHLLKAFVPVAEVIDDVYNVKNSKDAFYLFDLEYALGHKTDDITLIEYKFKNRLYWAKANIPDSLKNKAVRRAQTKLEKLDKHIKSGGLMQLAMSVNSRYSLGYSDIELQQLVANIKRLKDEISRDI